MFGNFWAISRFRDFQRYVNPTAPQSGCVQTAHHPCAMHPLAMFPRFLTPSLRAQAAAISSTCGEGGDGRSGAAGGPRQKPRAPRLRSAVGQGRCRTRGPRLPAARRRAPASRRASSGACACACACALLRSFAGLHASPCATSAVTCAPPEGLGCMLGRLNSTEDPRDVNWGASAQRP